mmetsp:Transcript_56314/g.112928  ORF Transcript_56314/g.112928 Transcript_56314/m.112928 type:complete len:204 (-) Transcript_56314:949-1560(-)
MSASAERIANQTIRILPTSTCKHAAAVPSHSNLKVKSMPSLFMIMHAPANVVTDPISKTRGTPQALCRTLRTTLQNSRRWALLASLIASDCNIRRTCQKHEIACHKKFTRRIANVRNAFSRSTSSMLYISCLILDKNTSKVNTPAKCKGVRISQSSFNIKVSIKRVVGVNSPGAAMLQRRWIDVLFSLGAGRSTMRSRCDTRE